MAELKTFASGLRIDYAAVQAALTICPEAAVRWSQPHWAEAQTCTHRRCGVKRQIYGRAHLDLLRISVLGET